MNRMLTIFKRRARFCASSFELAGRAEARLSVIRVLLAILGARNSPRYFDGELERSGSVRAGDFRFAAGKGTIDKRSELLPQRLFFFNRDGLAGDLSVYPAINLATLALVI